MVYTVSQKWHWCCML